MTLTELTVVTAVSTFVLAAAAAYSIPMIEAEKLASAVYDVQLMTQMARGEAVARNRECRFVIDADNGNLEVWDSLGTNTVNDDRLLDERRLPDAVVIARPDGGAPLTLERVGKSNAYQSVFDSDGTVTDGSGGVFLHGAGTFQAINVVDAGGVQIQKWDGRQWQSAYAGHAGTTNSPDAK